MRLYSYLALWTILLVVAVSFVASEDVTSEKTSVEQQTKLSWAKLHKFITFPDFKRVFHKSYASIQEEILRAKIFLGREVHRVSSLICYALGRCTSYLGTYKTSDLTENELEKMVMKTSQIRKLSHVGQRIKDVEEEKERVVAEDLEENIATSGTLGSKRQKRDTSQESELNFESLFESLKSVEPERKAQEEAQLQQQFIPWIINEENFIRKDFIRPDNSPDTENEKVIKQPDGMFVDYRNCLVEPKEQRECSSCYIFAMVAAYEWLYCNMTDGKPVSFSEQYILDCSELDCEGGLGTDVASWINENGLHLSQMYGPYEALVKQCPYSQGTDLTSVAHIRVEGQASRRIRNTQYTRFLKEGPIMGAVRSSLELLFHKGGVTQIKNCDPDNKHQVLIVGTGRENGIEYWLVRNSWGSDWAEGGYFKLDMKSECLEKYEGAVLEKEDFKFALQLKEQAE